MAAESSSVGVIGIADVLLPNVVSYYGFALMDKRGNTWRGFVPAGTLQGSLGAAEARQLGLDGEPGFPSVV